MRLRHKRPGQNLSEAFGEEEELEREKPGRMGLTGAANFTKKHRQGVLYPSTPWGGQQQHFLRGGQRNLLQTLQTLQFRQVIKKHFLQLSASLSFSYRYSVHLQFNIKLH